MSCEPQERCERPSTAFTAGRFELMERLRARVKQLIARRVSRRMHSRVDASDVVQDAFVYVSQHVPDLSQQNEEQLFATVRQIAFERAVDAYRRHIGAARRSVLREVSCERSLAGDSHDCLKDILAASSSSPSGSMVRRESLQQLRLALARFSEKDRNLLLLRHVKGLSVEQLAVLYRTNRRVVTTRHLRALKRLRRIVSSGGSQT